VTTYVLALPDQDYLTPNDRKHWSARKRCAKAWRDAVHVCALAAKLPRPIDSPVAVTLELNPSSRRRTDPDNLALVGKWAVDGLVQARVLVDDSAAHVHRTSQTISPFDGRKARSWLLHVTTVDGGGDG
jgi:Holliday junction resolvase RusA-like endonuclease